MSNIYFQSRMVDAKKDLEWLGKDLPLIGKNCLEIGCGVSEKTFYFGKFSRYSVGVDLSSHVKKAPAYIRQMTNAWGNISFAQADGQYLPFANHVFDVVLMHDTMEHISSPDNVISEVWRVLSKDGLFSIIMPHYYGLSGNHLWNYFGASIWRYMHLHLLLPDVALRKLVYAIGRNRNYSNGTIQEELEQYFTLNGLRPKKLKEYLEDTGFTVERFSYRRGKLPFQLLWNISWLEELFSWGVILVAKKNDV